MRRSNDTRSPLLALALLAALASAAACDEGARSYDRTPSDGLASGASPSGLRRLTAAQYRSAIRDVLDVDASELALPTDGAVGPFTSNAETSLSPLHVEQYAAAARTIAERIDLAALAPCAAEGVDATCASATVRDLGARLYRRPLSEVDAAAALAVWEVAREGQDDDDALRAAVAAMLQAPRFLYHVEVGAPVDGQRAKLDGFEVAARLAFFLWDAPPDEALVDAARVGLLDSRDGLRLEADRLLRDDRARAAVARFHVEWLGLEGVLRIAKDPDRYPIVDDALRAAMLWETTTFADWVVREGDGRLETLLSAPITFLRGPLFRVYGLVEPAVHDETRPVGLDPAERAGILTHPSVLAVHAHADVTSPVHRGLLVLEEVLCQTVGAPPEDVTIEPVRADPGDPRTRRERFAEHVADPRCATCHTAIDPLGFAFEHYDALGAYRTDDFDDGAPVDAASEVTTLTDVDGPVRDGVELARRLARSADVRACVARQWFRFAMGRRETAEDALQLDWLVRRFDASDGDVRGLLLDLVTTDAFRFVELPEGP